LDFGFGVGVGGSDTEGAVEADGVLGGFACDEVSFAFELTSPKDLETFFLVDVASGVEGIFFFTEVGDLGAFWSTDFSGVFADLVLGTDIVLFEFEFVI